MPAAAAAGAAQAPAPGSPSLGASILVAAEALIAARLARILSWTGIIIGATAIPALAATTHDQPERLLIPAFGGLVGCLGLWLLKQGRPTLAASVVLWGSWLVVAAGSLLNGGMLAPGLPGTIVFAAFSALVLGLRQGLGLCAATAGLCALLVAHEHSGQAGKPTPPEIRALLYVILGVMTVVMLWSTAAMLRTTARRALDESRLRSAAEAKLNASREELRRINAELEARVVERTNQLEMANRELQAFSYSVAHDLRAPLRAINGFSAAIAGDPDAVLSGESRADLARVRAACSRMGEQIDGLLRLSRLTRMEMKCSTADLGDLARQTVAALRLAHPDHAVELVIAGDLTAHADPDFMRLLLENLIGNAWKYSGKTRQPRIEIGRSLNGGETAFYVRDNGAGFDMAYVGQLFTPFRRLHAAHEFEGNGIGLATAQRIIARHGGRIWAEAQVDHGATFWFTLAAHAGRPAAPDRQTPPPAG